jgi:hypothetical protein
LRSSRSNRPKVDLLHDENYVRFGSVSDDNKHVIFRAAFSVTLPAVVRDEVGHARNVWFRS